MACTRYGITYVSKTTFIITFYFVHFVQNVATHNKEVDVPCNVLHIKHIFFVHLTQKLLCFVFVLHFHVKSFIRLFFFFTQALLCKKLIRLCSVGYRGIQGRLKPTLLDFAKRHSRLSSPNYGRVNLNTEPN